MSELKNIWYLSFVGDEGFRGVCLVESEDFLNAVFRARQLNINPGGEIQGWMIPREVYAKAPKQLPLNRLMDKATLIELGGPVISQKEIDADIIAKGGTPQKRTCAMCGTDADDPNHGHHH